MIEVPLMEYEIKVYLVTMAREYIQAHIENGVCVGESRYMSAYRRLAGEIEKHPEYMPEDLTQS